MSSGAPLAMAGRPGTEAAGPDAWDPPSVPRGPCQVAEPCPDCGTALWASERGTVRGCLACGRRVVPAGVADPYRQPGGDDAGRVVRSRLDRDAEARGLARSRGELLDRIRVIAGGGGLHPADAEVCDWYAAELRAAKTAARLAELADAIDAEQWHGRRWRDAGPDDPGPQDDDGWQDDDDGQDAAAARPAAGRAGSAAAEPPGITAWLAGRGIILARGSGCPVARMGAGPYRRGGQAAGYRWHAEMMTSPARGTIGVCRLHHAALTALAAGWDAAS
ncbi:MAG: hypothetical protein M0030_27115 [Actinomycetota bacterium]|nr:hypothetical protein [Actinomycetota bacterium]